MMILAGIDIGTNTLRLLIEEFSLDGRHRRIASKRHITRLGEDVSKTGRLKDAAMERTIRALEDFYSICNRYSIDGTYSVATSAVRDASNSVDFIRMVKARTELDVDVISGDEEARLTMLGVSSGLPPPPSIRSMGGGEGEGDILDGDIFLMDIGGGSTEFIISTGGKIKFKISTDIGVVRFTEQYIHSDPPEAEEIRLLESAIEERLDAIKEKGDRFIFPVSTGKINLSPFSFIGTAGTVTTLAAIDQEMTVYDPGRVNGYRISKDRIEGIREMLSRMTVKERREIPSIEEGREDIIIAGAVVVDKVMEWFGFAEIIVSDNGLREGLVIDLYNRLSHGKIKGKK